ncbi:SusC/RagA family TonB-linked outer membrane protein [Pseudobacter ginsenosidimutans]|nr:SusC/RagA family TonB-linked outer membrane protein [Pseudobacter ginsenosidimutans]
MKLTIFFTAIVFFQVQAANSLAQTVTISGKDLTLKQVFAAIEKQTDYVLLNTKGTLEGTKTVSLTVHKMPLKEFLDFVLKEQELEYEIHGNTILLSKMQAVVDKTVPGIIQIFPQNNLVYGQVVNEEGYPLSGVSIFVRKANRGTYTDALGKFSIQANPGDSLVFSFIGYAGQQLKITSNQLLVRMKVTHSVMDEMKVTAYGKTSKRTATGNITTIKAEEITKQPIFNPLQALVGRVPGVAVLQTSGNLAAPIELVIRGRNNISPTAIIDPLYVIDGLPLSNNNIHPSSGGTNISMGPVQGGNSNTGGESPLNMINPNDIESITILKDADATAIYGSRGANGVVLITTKKGKSGPPVFNLRIANGINSIQKYPKVLSTKDYLAVRREALRNDGIVPNIVEAPDLVLWDSTRNKDWQRELIGTGVETNINLSVSGGAGNSTYRLSGGYMSSTTLLNQGGKNERISFNSTFNYVSTNQKFRFALINSLATTNVKAIKANDPSSLPPNAPEIYNNKGEFNFEPYRTTGTAIFPFSDLKRPSVSKTFSNQTSVNLDYNILKGLSMGLSGNYAFSHNDIIQKSPEASFDTKLPNTPIAIYGNTKARNWQIQQKVEYQTFIGKGSLSIKHVAEYAAAATGSQTIFAMFFPNDEMMKSYNNAGFVQASEASVETRILKFTGMVNYNWSNKYIFSLSATRDGSSSFGKGKRFGNFGSVALAWNANEEKWIKQILPSWFTFLKFRGSYGLTGASSLTPYEFLSRWSKNVSDGMASSLLPYDGIMAFHVIKPLNQEFRWVSTRKAELTIEMGFLQDRINLEASVYHHSSTDQLGSVPIPKYTGFSQAFTNTQANLRNTGFEFSMSAKLLSSKDWALTTSFVLGLNRNKLVDFPNLEYSSHKGNLKVGYSNTTKYVLRYTGINPLTGEYSFEDHNKDGRITVKENIFPSSYNDDRYIAIETAEKYSGGFTFELSWKELSFYTQFDFKNRLRRDPYIMAVVGERKNIALPGEILNNHWRQPGDIVSYPKFTTRSAGLGRIESSDAAYVNGSYIRLNVINISWNIPNTLTKKIGIKNASIGVSTNNLFTFSSYRGLDPQIDNIFSAAPIPRVISSNLNINF